MTGTFRSGNIVPLLLAGQHGSGGSPLFVRTEQGQWNNLARASAVTVEPDRHNLAAWVVLAHYSGRTIRLRSFPTEHAAHQWADDIIGSIR